MSADTPTLTTEIARVVRLGYTADHIAEEGERDDGEARALGDTLRSIGARLRRLLNEREAEHRAEVGRLTALTATELPDDVEGAAVTFDAHPLESREDLVSAGLVLVRYMTELRAEVERLKGLLAFDDENGEGSAWTELHQSIEGLEAMLRDERAEAARLRERVAELEGELEEVTTPDDDSPFTSNRDRQAFLATIGGTPTGATPSEPSFADEMARGCAAFSEGEPGGES